MSTPPIATLRPLTLGRHVRETLALAWPVMLARTGIVGFTIVDILVLGRAGAEPLADYVLGQALFDGTTGLAYGLLLGVPVLTARAIGAGHPEQAGLIWRRGLVYAALIGLAIAALLQFTETLLIAVGHDPALAARSAVVARLLGIAMIPAALYFVSALFLEAINRPLPGMIAVLIANLTNFGLNIVLVFGYFGFPAMGAAGTATATIINLSLLAFGLGLYVRFVLPQRPRLGIDRANRDGMHWRSAGAQRRIGYAAGVSYGLEASAFTTLTLIVGLLGVNALAAHGVLFQTIAFTFMIAFGVAAATQVRVSQAWGRGADRDMIVAGWAGLAVASLANVVMVTLYLLAPLTVIGLFTSELGVVATALPIMPWLALIVLIDGGQGVMNLACRGRGDTWFPTALHFGSYWLVMVPSASWFTLGLGHGLAGIYQGVTLASAISLTVLTLRFLWLARKHPPPIVAQDPDRASRQ